LMRPYALKVETADSGYEAIEKISGGAEYDIVFMDHMMPGMDGIETVQKLREGGYTRPIVALTANAVTGQSDIFLKNGFDDFISKPIDTRRLNFILNKLIRDKQPPEVLEEARQQKNAVKDHPAGRPDNVFISRLKSIDGLEADAALEVMGGMHDFYADTVRITVRWLPIRLNNMDKWLEKGDLKAFAMEAHSLKSVLRTIGVAALGSIAASLERWALDNDQDYCAKHYHPFKNSLTELMEKLNAALPDMPADAKETADSSRLIIAIAGLKAAVESYDSILAVQNLAPCREFSYGAKLDRLIEKISLSLEAFNFDEAMNHVIEMEGILNGTVG